MSGRSPAASPLWPIRPRLRRRPAPTEPGLGLQRVFRVMGLHSQPPSGVAGEDLGAPLRIPKLKVDDPRI